MGGYSSAVQDQLSALSMPIMFVATGAPDKP